MTETPAAAVEITCFGGPLDGRAFADPGHGTVLNAIAYRTPDGTLSDPREEIVKRGFEPDLPMAAWPPDIKARIVPIEYLIDRDHGVAAFREPAVIRETSKRQQQENDREWVDATARQSQNPRWIAWKVATNALTAAMGETAARQVPADCKHDGGRCQTFAMHYGRVAVDAILGDGLRIVEPTRLREGGQALAYLFHEAYERLAPEFGYETRQEARTPWEDVPEQNRRLMAATAAEVLSSIDAEGRVITITLPEDAPADLDFHGLGDVLRDEAGASLLLAMPKALGITMQSLDREQMAAEGWFRLDEAKPEVMTAPVYVVTRCPTCWESFTILTDGHAEPADDVNTLGDALREHVRAEHDGEAETATVMLVEVESGLAAGGVVPPTDMPSLSDQANPQATYDGQVSRHPEPQHPFGTGCRVCDGDECPYCGKTPPRIEVGGDFVWDTHDYTEGAPCKGSGSVVGSPQ